MLRNLIVPIGYGGRPRRRLLREELRREPVQAPRHACPQNPCKAQPQQGRVMTCEVLPAREAHLTFLKWEDQSCSCVTHSEMDPSYSVSQRTHHLAWDPSINPVHRSYWGWPKIQAMQKQTNNQQQQKKKTEKERMWLWAEGGAEPHFS